jgi:lipoprotein NlpD
MKSANLFSLAVPLIVVLLSACGGHVYHVVERGETLYSIGWIYGYDYRQLAQWNGIEEPYYLNPGQRLRVAPPPGNAGVVAVQEIRIPEKPAPVSGTAKTLPEVVDKTITAAAVLPAVKFNPPVADRPLVWQWPTSRGEILQTFSAKDPGRQGVDIAGETGTHITAAASGRVVYAGGGLARYGKLIIVKHNETFLSAYAHNDKLRVKENEEVEAGQLIAEMGSSGTQRPKLHFEIRRNGKPVDPLQYLPKR